MRPVRVGIVDSGINPRHRQVGRVPGGVGIHVDSGGAIQLDDDWIDRLGHGTAVAATIHGHAPEAELYAIRIFRRRLEAHSDALCHAVDWARSHELDVLNLSLGCADREDDVLPAEPSSWIVVAPSTPSLSRGRDGVIAVRDDPALGVDEVRFEHGDAVASPWARPLGELPKERNFHGVSLAVAHVTGMVASLLAEGVPKGGVGSALRERCEKIGS